LDLLPIPTESRVSFEVKTMAKEMKKLHDQIRVHIEKANEACKARENKNRKQLEFKPGVGLATPKEREIPIKEEEQVHGKE